MRLSQTDCQLPHATAPCNRPESRIAVVSHCGFLAHGMRALGKDMLKTWSDAMLQQCSSNASNDSSAAPVRPDGNATALGTGSLSTALDAQRAELLRSTAGELAGRMSVDWHNCEMRSVQLCWGPGVHHAPDAVGDGDAAGQGWLWAKPGDAAEWFPGEWRTCYRYMMKRVWILYVAYCLCTGKVHQALLCRLR